MLLHQSDLGAMSRCMAEYGYKRAGVANSTNSAAVYGTVMHHSLLVFERQMALGDSEALALNKAIETFIYYWLPANVSGLTDPVPADGWLPNQGYAELRERGIDALKRMAVLIRMDEATVLAQEFGFVVDIDGSWDPVLQRPHQLAGSIDRLVTRHYSRKIVVGVDDWKTGAEYRFLRQNLQGTAYCYASTKREFWIGNGGEDGFGEERGNRLFEQFTDAGRRFTWINVKSAKYQDGGWRGPDDYNRLALAADQFAALVAADIYPLAISGEHCKFCSARTICGGTGVPANDHGAPVKSR